MVGEGQARREEATMCFVHGSGAGGAGLVQQAAVGAAAAGAFSGVAAAGGEAARGLDVAGSGTPDVVAGPGARPQAAGQAGRVLDGFGRVLHNRWNRDLPPAATVRPGEGIQLLCRDALDIGEAARTLTPEGRLTLDLGGVHPLTGPVEVTGAEPGDVLEVEVLDVAPLVDFGYVVISPVLGLFGSRRTSPTTAARRSCSCSPSSAAKAAGSPPSPARTPAGGRGSRSPRSWASTGSRRCARACTAPCRPASAAAWAATPTSGSSPRARGSSSPSTRRARCSPPATGTWPRATARCA